LFEYLAVRLTECNQNLFSRFYSVYGRFRTPVQHYRSSRTSYERSCPFENKAAYQKVIIFTVEEPNDTKPFADGFLRAENHFKCLPLTDLLKEVKIGFSETPGTEWTKKKFTEGIRGGTQNIPDWCRHLYSSCGNEKQWSQQAKL
jgi:hypothetical protein